MGSVLITLPRPAGATDTPPTTAASGLSSATAPVISGVTGQLGKIGLSLLPTASMTVPLGGEVWANANLLGASLLPTGTMTYDLFGPTDPSCTASPIFTSTVAVAATSIDSARFTPTTAGTYHWTETYSGDLLYSAVGPTACSAPAAAVVVDTARVIMNITSVHQDGSALHATATVAGGVRPTGTLSFTASAPGDTFCSGPAAYSASVAVNGDGTYDSGAFLPTRSGTYKWRASFTGDSNNKGVSVTSCLDANAAATFVHPARADDYDGDGRSDPAVSRPSQNTWYVSRSSGGTMGIGSGVSGATDVPGDYDGDGKTDAAEFVTGTGAWYVHLSSGGDTAQTWGTAGDVPVPGDYDGDGKTDMAIYRPSSGAWYVYLTSTSSGYGVAWGQAGDIPVPADYDGDGKADLAVFRPSTGTWYVHGSAGADTTLSWGESGDLPLPADYDGNGKADLAVFRPSTGTWYVRHSSGATSATAWGTSGDVPVPGDYDGDAKADLAVYRPAGGGWYLWESHDGQEGESWGAPTDTVVGLAPALRQVASAA
ncbi:MAG: FG-GAP repeat domain-containing protein [Acidimicrobiales bacterium]